ncbi:unnamed protein product [Adineta ricciae]|uniref:Uncharacterized protein n=1 Tax=Adineta ricciae TaxID=249248 RepID=A0A815BTD2_ADIRI|nr:unnamed protein product [Adineta ricciae]CAF1271597.1 unnamed protein product [Adineta ricciae]
MTIFYDRMPSTVQARSQSTLNIKLKTPSLTCLNIPLDNSFGIRETSSSFTRNEHHRVIAGSVDLISEISNQTSDETWARFLPSKPLMSFVSPDQPQEWPQVLKENFRTSTSMITATSLNDSLVRLRRHRQLTKLHQSSLQTIDRLIERKHRFSFNYHRPLPKFVSRNASWKTRSSFRSNSRMAPFTSLPEIHCLTEQNSIRDAVPLSSVSNSWEKSGSWSWRSSNPSSLSNQRKESNIRIPRRMDDYFQSNLPAIIESPLQQRPSLQTLDHQRIPRMSNPLYQRRTFLSHSTSNYDMSPNLLSSTSKIRYPSTPVLVHPHQKQFNQFYTSSLTTFDDDDDDDDTDSIQSNSSFRSCVNSLSELSDQGDIDSTSSSSSSDSYFPESSSAYNVPQRNLPEPIKSTRLSFRQLCILQ